MWPLQHIHLQRQETGSRSVIAAAGDGGGPNVSVGRIPKMVPASGPQGLCVVMKTQIG